MGAYYGKLIYHITLIWNLTMETFTMMQADIGRNLRRLDRHASAWMLCAVLLGLAACVQLPDAVEVKKVDKPILVYPEPPDEARFIYERTIYSNRDVDKSEVEKASVIKNIVGDDSTGVVLERLKKPYAVSVNRGRIFVSDPVARVVKVFDVPQGRYFRIGEESPGALMKPIGIDTDDSGTLYVADATLKAVMVYDRDGKFLRKIASAKIGEPPVFSRLASVTVDKNGEKIYAVDIGGSRSENEVHRIRVFDAHSGAHLFDIGSRGSEPGEFNLPRDVAIGKNGELFVVDGGNFRVQVLDSKGKYLRSFGKVGQQMGDLARPKEAAIDLAGNVYVTDTLHSNFQIFNPSGELLMYIGTQSGIDGPAHYRLLAGITVDEDGRVYVVDQYFRKVDIFRPAALAENEGYLSIKELPVGAASAVPPGESAPKAKAAEEKAGGSLGQMILDNEEL